MLRPTPSPLPSRIGTGSPDPPHSVIPFLPSDSFHEWSILCVAERLRPSLGGSPQLRTSLYPSPPPSYKPLPSPSHSRVRVIGKPLGIICGSLGFGGKVSKIFVFFWIVGAIGGMWAKMASRGGLPHTPPPSCIPSSFPSSLLRRIDYLNRAAEVVEPIRFF